MVKAVDLFAGGGGFTTGAAMAGVRVVWAANHWQAAVDCHARNHPGVEHVCQDLHQANWLELPRFDLLLASPCCQGHTAARGRDLPHHDASRSTAWAVVACCDDRRPKAFIVENVPEFLKWELYPNWEATMRKLGYAISTNIVDAADAGLAQNRVRLFIVGVRGGQPLPIPPAKARPKTAADIIDFNAGKWRPVDVPGRSSKTLARANNGRRSFGRRFVMPYYGSGSGLTGRSLDRPLGTVTTRDRWAVVDGGRMRMLTVDEYRRAMGFPADYWLPPQRHTAIHLLGNAVPPPLAKHVIRHVAQHVFN